MTWIRSLAFVAWLYLSLVLFTVGLSPALLMAYPQAMWVIRHWSKFTLFGLRWIGGVKVEFRGLEHMPVGAGLIAGKHQSMLDVIAPFAVLPDNCFIMKKELAPLPFFGWFAVKTRMIAVDRSAHSKALKDMVRQARLRFAEGRQMLIFPEGTRAPVGAPADYKPGIAALYRDLDCPCTPMATNSGVHWPAHGFRRYPGTVVYEFLPAIPAGLKRAEFMAVLEERIEGASGALLIASSTASMTSATKDRLRLAMKSFATSLGFLAIVSVGGNCLASLYRRSHLPNLEELAVPALIALLGAIAITVWEQIPLWRDRIPQRRR